MKYRFQVNIKLGGIIKFVVKWFVLGIILGLCIFSFSMSDSLTAEIVGIVGIAGIPVFILAMVAHLIKYIVEATTIISDEEK